MTLQQAIEIRRSRRKYLPHPIDRETTEKLQALLLEYGKQGTVDMRLVLNDEAAWNGLTKSYGLFSNVRNYVGLIHQKGDWEELERLGYYGELWALQATVLGLGTCWVGGSFRRSRCPFVLTKGEMIACAISVGPVFSKLSGKEKWIHHFTHRKTKSAEDMIQSDAPLPGWAQKGMQAVQKAPSALNRQPVLFSYRDGILSASIEQPNDIGSVLDFGIAKAHFELGAGGGAWKWGNGGIFCREKKE